MGNTARSSVFPAMPHQNGWDASTVLSLSVSGRGGLERPEQARLGLPHPTMCDPVGLLICAPQL